MSVTKHHAIQMRLVQILRALSRVIVFLDSLEMEHTVKMSMNVMTVHVIQMQHAPTWLDLTHVLATLDTLVMEHTVKILMNALYHHPVTQMQPAITPLDHTRADVIQGTQEMELIAMVSIVLLL